jgi:membrane protease YdiL (CAAX protease family)
MDVVEIISRFASSLTLIDIIVAPGLILFGIWLLRTSWGRKALADSAPRPNNMPPYLPLVPLVVWFGGVWLAVAVKQRLITGLAGWQSAFVDNIVLCVSGGVTAALIIFLARASFARRLKGFGLNVRTLGRDIPGAVVNLLAIWPLVWLATMVTIYVGQLIFGRDYQMQQHEELKLISQHSELPLRILIFVVAAVVAPLLEEMLFRGMFQSVIRSFLAPGSVLEMTGRRRSAVAWVSILATSVLFTMVHPNTDHWPALFVLSLGLGYSYEKRGSLFRPMIMHSLFNATNVISTMYL